MLGILLLLGGIGFGVGNYGVYQKYRRAVAHAEEVRRHPESLNGSRCKPEEIIAMSESDAAFFRERLLRFGAVMFLFLSVAFFLLIRAAKTYRRIKNLQYEEIDWRAFEKPTRRVEVSSTRYQNRLAIGLIAFFGLTTILISRSCSAARILCPKTLFTRMFCIRV